MTDLNESSQCNVSPCAMPESVSSYKSRDEIEAFVSDIESQVCASNGVAFHSMVALNHIMRQPNASELVDQDLKVRMADLWHKLKSVGFELQDPPLLFGLPEFTSKSDAVDENLDDGTDAIEIVLPADEEDENKKRPTSSNQDDSDDEDDDYDEL